MAGKASSHVLHTLDRIADDAVFQDQLSGLVVTFHENERPLQGLAGLMDWRFQGALSSYLRAGALSGKKGECAYVPLTRHGKTIHLILVGAGSSSAPGTRRQPDETMMSVLRENLASLKLPKLGISRSDFGGVNDEFFTQRLSGVPIWIVN